VERPYRAWGYPVTPLVYIALSLWTLGTLLTERPLASLAGLGTVLVGALIWRLAGGQTAHAAEAPAAS
jgi:APA family basic amino acid/polyamine antiporter